MAAKVRLSVEVQGDDIVVTLPDTSYVVTYYRAARRSRCPHDASRVSRSSMEARQLQGARAGVDSVDFHDGGGRNASIGDLRESP